MSASERSAMERASVVEKSGQRRRYPSFSATASSSRRVVGSSSSKVTCVGAGDEKGDERGTREGVRHVRA